MSDDPVVTDPAAVVDAFITAVEQRDMATAATYLADDVEYDNVPMGKTHGAAEVAAMLGPFIERCEVVDWPVYRQVADGPIVFNERFDRFQLGDHWIEMPVIGVWEVHDGKITLWRDYFDLATYTTQMAAASGD